MPTEPIHDDEPWSAPLPDESNLWFDRFCRYVAMGPARSVRAVYQAEKDHERSRSVPASWTQASHRFEWQRRAQAYDGRQRAIVLASGNAQDTTRITKLDVLAEKMHSRLVAELDSVQITDRFIGQYLAVLDLLAKHTGGYAAQRIEHTGKDGKAIEVEETHKVIFYVPEIERSEDTGDIAALPDAVVRQEEPG